MQNRIVGMHSTDRNIWIQPDKQTKSKKAVQLKDQNIQHHTSL